MTQLIISLTSIPPRFPYLQETLASLVNQQAEVAAVNIYIPRKYRRFDFSPEQVPSFIQGVNVRLVDTDYGPATKVLPAVREYRGQDVRILFCDDDKVYDPQWAQRFVECSDRHPDCCIVEEGGDVSNYSNHNFSGARQPRSGRITKDLGYRAKRALSLGTWKPRKNVGSGFVDMLEGWGGVLVRPEFFTDAAFDIPDILWMVDDIWLSGQLAVNGVPIWLNGEDKIRTKGSANEVKEAALRKLVQDGYGRTEANQACVDYFREKHRIWGGG